MGFETGCSEQDQGDSPDFQETTVQQRFFQYSIVNKWRNRCKFEIAMMKNLLTVALLTFSISAFSQTRLVMANDSWVVIDNGAALVIDHGIPGGITTLGGGNISSEAENDRIRWNIGNTVGTYNIPYTNNSGVKIPFTYFVASAGSANGSIVFSTYNHEVNAGANWNNDLYRPSDVTHMLDWATGSVNNSGNAVDRFWIVDPNDATYGYTTNPLPRLTFNYDPVSDLAVGNTITSATNVGAQRFNTGIGQWGDMLPQGVWSAGATNTVTVTTVPSPADFFRSWTLADFANPLPVEIVRLEGECQGDRVEIMWTTATESNNDYFTIEKSTDGLVWDAIGTIQGAGTSVSSIDYSFIDPNPTTLAYYRLIQTDYDGTTSTSNIIAAGCEGSGGTQIVNVWDDGSTVTLVVNSTDLSEYDLTLTDAQGKELVTRPSQVINEGITNLTFEKGLLATGVYVVRLHNGDEMMSRRIVLN